VVLLGAGGSARAVTYALLTAGVADLAIYNRSLNKAQAIAQDLRALGKINILTTDGLKPAVRIAELLINTTSVGLAQGGTPDLSPLPQGLLPDDGLVCDIVYRPARTRLLREAAAAGLRTLGGAAMLAYQGAASFTAWFGVEAPVAAMRAAIEEALELE